MQGEDNPPGQSRPLTAGTGSPVKLHVEYRELRESSPQFLRQMA